MRRDGTFDVACVATLGRTPPRRALRRRRCKLPGESGCRGTHQMDPIAKPTAVPNTTAIVNAIVSPVLITSHQKAPSPLKGDSSEGRAGRTKGVWKRSVEVTIGRTEAASPQTSRRRSEHEPRLSKVPLDSAWSPVRGFVKLAQLSLASAPSSAGNGRADEPSKRSRGAERKKDESAGRREKVPASAVPAATTGFTEESAGVGAKLLRLGGVGAAGARPRLYVVAHGVDAQEGRCPECGLDCLRRFTSSNYIPTLPRRSHPYRIRLARPRSATIVKWRSGSAHSKTQRASRLTPLHKTRREIPDQPSPVSRSPALRCSRLTRFALNVLDSGKTRP